LTNRLTSVKVSVLTIEIKLYSNYKL